MKYINKTLTLLWTALLLLTFNACDSSLEDTDARYYLDYIIASVQEENALRVDLEMQFKHTTDYTIAYWKKNDESSVQETPVAQSKLNETKTLVLLEPNTEYNFKVKFANGSSSSIYSFTTKSLPATLPTYDMTLDDLKEEIGGYYMLTRSSKPGLITIIDTKGTVVWYEYFDDQAVWVANYDKERKELVAIVGNNPSQAYTGTHIIVMDLWGNKRMSQNVTNLYPHHDCRFLPNGNIIFVNFVPKEFDLTVHGGTKKETVWGDGYTIIDQSGKIIDRWDCFATINPVDDVDIMSKRGDWIHANAVTYDTAGNYYMTFNFLSELWKINSETKEMIYRVGPKGNVNIDPKYHADGIHSPYIGTDGEIMVFDNGMSRGTSRVLIYNIDENSKIGKASEVKYPTEYSSIFMGNAKPITDDLLVVGASFSYAIVLADMQGAAKRILKTNYSFYRAEYYKEINF